MHRLLPMEKRWVKQPAANISHHLILLFKCMIVKYHYKLRDSSYWNWLIQCSAWQMHSLFFAIFNWRCSDVIKAFVSHEKSYEEKISHQVQIFGDQLLYEFVRLLVKYFEQFSQFVNLSLLITGNKITIMTDVQIDSLEHFYQSRRPN